MRLALALATMVVIASSALASDTAIHTMSDQDFFLDRKTLLGKSVEVSSTFEVKGDMMFMSLPNDTNATFVNFDKLPREVRKNIYARCQSNCKGTVQGKVAIIGSPFGNDIGINADRLTLDQ